MDKPSIELETLRKYVEVNRQYSLEISGNNVQLHFFPNTPEALRHFPDDQGVEHVMYGIIEEDRVYFTSFLTRSSFGETRTEIEGADDPIMEWLKYL